MEDAKWSLHVKRIIRREGVRTYFDRVFAAKFPPITWKDKVTVCYEVLLGIFVFLLVDRIWGSARLGLASAFLIVLLVRPGGQSRGCECNRDISPTTVPQAFRFLNSASLTQVTLT